MRMRASSAERRRSSGENDDERPGRHSDQTRCIPTNLLDPHGALESDAEVSKKRLPRESMASHHETLRVELVDWVEAEPAIRAIRQTVFIFEQAVPEELEWDGLDPSCAHALAWTDLGDAIGTARMQVKGTIGRMAVLKNWRGRGVGSTLLQTLLALAAKQGLSRVTLSAQTHAVGFYEQAGFHVIGEPFMDADIPHRKMVKELLLGKVGQEER